ncbi:hypothetical protein D3C85_1936560 [compost metagenome]
MEISADVVTSVVIVDVLSVGSGSGVVESTVAVLVIESVTDASTVPRSKIVAEAPFANVPMLMDSNHGL